MRIAIIGAGAVGGYYGALLARAGQDVTFIARGANLQAIRERGIVVRSDLGDFEVRAKAVDDPAEVGAVDLVIIAVKTYSNPQALAHLPVLTGSDTVVLTLQNGVDSASDVAAFVPKERVLTGATYIASTLVAPGTIEHLGTVRRIVFGEAFGAPRITERVSAIRDVLAQAGIQADAVPDVRIALWEKFIFLAPLAALTAASRLPIGPAWDQQAFRTVCEKAMREVEALARHAGVAVAPDIVDEQMAQRGKSPRSMRTSMMVDLTSGRPLELDALIGSVVRRGIAAGIPTPVMETAYGILRPHQDGTARGE
jgi:2-dehydropantoate 2-reductase